MVVEVTSIVGNDTSNIEGSRRRRWYWFGALAVALALYRATMAPGVLWGDSGEAQLHVLLGGWYLGEGEIVRSHVLYYAIARCLRWCFSLEAYHAANLVAAVAGAVTVANVAWLSAALCRTRTAVFCGTTLLLLSHTLWQQSTGAEVLTLTTALLTLELALCVKLVETSRLRWIALIGLTSGLGLSNHNLAMLMWPVYAVVAFRYRAAWASYRGRACITAMGALLVGAVPVLVLCFDHFAAHGSLGDTVQSLLVGHYQENVSNIGRLPVLIARAAAATVLNFPTPLIVAGLLGVIGMRSIVLAPMRWITVGGLLMYGAFGARYDVPDQHTFLLPAFCFFGLMIAVGVDRLVSHARPRWCTWMLCACAGFAPMVYAVLPAVLRSVDSNVLPVPRRIVPYRDPLKWFVQPWRCGYDGPERFAMETLSALPVGAWLDVDSTLLPPLNYVQACDGLRRDVRLDCVLARQSWFDDGAEAFPRLRRAKLEAGLLFAATDDRRYLATWLREARVRLEAFGLVYRVVLDE